MTWSVRCMALHGSETWTLTGKDVKMLDLQSYLVKKR